MKILGIIVEYNPFHTGHLYHLQKAKEMVKPDLTIAIMSGNYVQRGEVAIIDKFKRSELAIKYGVDLVIELPFAYVCQSADYFCKGAIDLLYHIGITDLVFGSECGDIDTFKEIAYAIKNHPNEYDQYVKAAMKKGLRYPDACNQALSLLLNKSIKTPNDLLGLGYVKEVIENDYPITLHCIKRSNDYHDTTLTKIASATALRKALKEKQDVHDYLLDILTDTTERQPTFTLPPFRRFNDTTSELSWAFIKDPLYPTEVAWHHVFRRPITGLDWTKEDYIRMGAAQSIVDNPPLVGSEQVFMYYIGNEDDPSRYSRKPNCLVCLDINGSATPEVMKWFKENVTKFEKGVVVRMGAIPKGKLYENEIHIPCKFARTSNELLTHLMVKLAFNVISTATMAKMGRVWSNWMIQVLPTNKKLIDRSTRIIANIANIPYEQACEEFFKSYLGRDPKEEYRESYVVETLKRLGFDPKDDIK